MSVFITLINYDSNFTLVDRVFKDQKEAQAYLEAMTKDQAAGAAHCRELVDDLGLGGLGKFVTEDSIRYSVIRKDVE